MTKHENGQAGDLAEFKIGDEVVLVSACDLETLRSSESAKELRRRASEFVKLKSSSLNE